MSDLNETTHKVLYHPHIIFQKMFVLLELRPFVRVSLNLAGPRYAKVLGQASLMSYHDET